MKRINGIILLFILLIAGFTTTAAQNPFSDEPVQNLPTVSHPGTGTPSPSRPNSNNSTSGNGHVGTGNSGLVFKYNNLHYKILSEKTVEVTGEVRSVCKGRVEIPNIVKHNDKTYKVVGIGVAAFNSQTKLTEVVIPKTIQYIEKQAFGFTGLTDVIIPGDKVKVKKWAFLNCDNLKVVTLNGKKPQCSASAFELCSKMKELRIRGIASSNNGKKLKGTNAVIKVIK
jgi:hypothetical protein